MMTEFVFNPKKLKDGLSLVRIIKPEIGDFNIRFDSSSLIIASADKRKYIKVVIAADSAPLDFKFDETYVGADRVALFDTELDSVSISVNEKSLSVKMHGNDQVRKASITKKSVRIKAPEPNIDFNNMTKFSIDKDSFDQILRQISCSALVKETKTEEEMRINQVHFYPTENCVVSNARYYGSIAFLDGMKLDFSIISSDIPLVRSFCARCDGSTVDLCCDNQKLCVTDPNSGSMLVLGRIMIPKPPLSLFDPEGFNTIIAVDRDQLAKNLSWANLVIEGTQRLGIYAQGKSEPNDQMTLFFGQDEISRFPVKFIKGNEIRADFPVNVLTNIIGFIEGTAILKFNHEKASTLLEISQEQSDIRSMHYLQSMRTR